MNVFGLGSFFDKVFGRISSDALENSPRRTSFYLT